MFRSRSGAWHAGFDGLFRCPFASLAEGLPNHREPERGGLARKKRSGKKEHKFPFHKKSFVFKVVAIVTGRFAAQRPATSAVRLFSVIYKAGAI